MKQKLKKLKHRIAKLENDQWELNGRMNLSDRSQLVQDATLNSLITMAKQHGSSIADIQQNTKKKEEA